MRRWFIRHSATRLYGVEWWGFSRRWMVVTRHRFGYGWIVTVGPLRVYRALVSQPAGPEQEK